MTGDTESFRQNIELRIYPDPFFTSCHISSMNKKARSKNPLKPKANFKWVFVDIIPAASPKHFTSETIFLIIFELLMHTQKYQNFMIWKELLLSLMDKLDMFQARFGKVDEFG